MAELIVIVGPIASGKTATATELAGRLRQRGEAVAVVELDDVVAMLGGFVALSERAFRTAQAVNARTIGAWLENGVSVIAPGPFFEAEEVNALTQNVPARTTVRWAQLRTPLDITVARATADPSRATSRNPQFLARAYQRALTLLADHPRPEWSFDTTTMSVEVIADQMARTIA